MKLSSHHPTDHRQAGILLMECLVYLSVLTILLALGSAAFYSCWDHTRAVITTSSEIESALQAGERWRADIRSATGPILVETNATGEIVRIPKADQQVCYRFEAEEIHREINTNSTSWRLPAKVIRSEMQPESRAGVTAWHWELELKPARKEVALPLRFTFAAAQPKP